jgi:hypothetical protein
MKETMASLTIFNNIYDNKTHQRMDYDSFDEFEAVLFKLSESTKYPTKKDAPLISPAIYKKDATRCNDGVVAWAGWCAVDVDVEVNEEPWNKYYHIKYSTASSTVDLPKFRLVFPLTRYVNKEEIKHFWFALNKELGEIGDAQTKDLSRMYYIPAKYEGAHNFIYKNKGKLLDPSILMEQHRYVVQDGSFFDKLPPAIRQGLMDHRKNQLNNKNYTWTGYKDCPFVNQKKIEEYKRLNDGWYYALYQLMVSIAGNAIAKGYPITAKEVEYIIRDLDAECGNWYLKRPIDKEAERAIEFVFSKNI